MAITDDNRWAETEGAPDNLSSKLLHRYLDAVIELVTENPEVAQHFAEVSHLIKPAYQLFHPSILIRLFGRFIISFTQNRSET
ncbi:MAG: hypothetical protein R3281_14575 [Balneolaceae bacterium]|nr:hypothetical protein [Balneolaceae bacterium]